MKKLIKIWKSDVFDDLRFTIITLTFVFICCALLFSMAVYNFPKVQPTESEAREEILTQFPACENEIEKVAEKVTWSYPNAGSFTNTVNYLVCKSEEVKIQYFVPSH